MGVVGDVVGYVCDYLDEDTPFVWAEGATKGEAEIDEYAPGRCADVLCGRSCLCVEPSVGGLKVVFTEEDWCGGECSPHCVDHMDGTYEHEPVYHGFELAVVHLVVPGDAW